MMPLHDALAAADESARQLLAALRGRPDAYLVGIAGIPGSGKSTLCAAIRERIPDHQRTHP